MTKIKCVLCNSKRFKELFYKDDMTIVKCLNCGLIFTNPQPEQQELTNHYDKNYYCCPKKDITDCSRYRDYNARYLKGKETERFQEIFKNLEEKLSAKGKLLDVGSATGFFIKEANSRGWQAEGVEISKWATDWGRKNLKVKIFNGDLRKANFKKESFDVVTMLDFLEHVKNPMDELKETSRIIKKGGIIYAETINFDNWITKHLIGEKYIHMVPKFHLFYFGQKQLYHMLKKCGYKVLDIKLTSSSVGDYEYDGFSMYWQYLKLIFKSKKNNNYAFKDVIKIYAQKI